MRIPKIASGSAFLFIATRSRAPLSCSLCIISLPLFAESAPARFALVIGNGSYAELGRLANPANDAEDMAAALKMLGFDNSFLIDADLSSMESGVVSLGNKLASAQGSTGFFYYAGHGVLSNGVNYLIPADAHIASEAFIKTRALAAQEVLETLAASKNGLEIKEVFNRTGVAARNATAGKQVPAVYCSGSAWTSDAFPIGKYHVAIGGRIPYSTEIQVKAGAEVELPGYRDTVLRMLRIESGAPAQSLGARRGKSAIGMVSSRRASWARLESARSGWCCPPSSSSEGPVPRLFSVRSTRSTRVSGRLASEGGYG